jgi:hypothetical protein
VSRDEYFLKVLKNRNSAFLGVLLQHNLLKYT